MTITIDLPAATEKQLRAQAAATGKSIGTLVLEAVQARLALADLSFKELLGPVHEDFRLSGMSEHEREMLLDDSLKEARSARRSATGSSE